MTPVPLPFSLSPHICILSSPDLSSLLESSSLPPLPQLLQSFSPLPNVTTRSTSLTSIPHNSFFLRFSDLPEIEAACREDDGQRAMRTIDWIGARLNNRCAKWVQDVENASEKERLRTPWWDELRHCAEGDHVPSKTEGWNHPVSVILAVSTMVANPLQAITALHTRALDFPPWVDNTFFRYTLIVHPRTSPLSSEEAGALFNAVKRQYGLHSYLLPLDLPSPPSPPVPVPALLPRLPPPELEISVLSAGLSLNSSPQSVNTLRLCENDIQQTGKFTREFLVMSLLPWMEKCALEWNENFTSTRRLPSRLFSSTRRLFGSQSPSPVPHHNSSSSISSVPRSLHSSSAGRLEMTVPPPSQQHRLAEFATILGDYKLATTVWEALRKDGKGGADILPILLTPSPTIPTYVFNALSNIAPSPTELTPQAQLRALLYAVRWEASIPTSDFLGDVLGGERWLVWAAGDAEEAPSALLLAHAALLCARKGSNRRGALWYLMAANRLEKIGIKPLTIHFLRKAQELYRIKPQKLLSPSFWDSEYKSPNEIYDFDAILAGIEHPLGRLLYTTGDIADAVRLFVGLLRGSTVCSEQQNGNKALVDPQDMTSIKLFLEDFRVAFEHLKSTINYKAFFDQLKLPIQFCIPRLTFIRLSRDRCKQGDPVWELREEAWLSFRKRSGGKEQLEKSGKAMVGETFWIDLAMQNPLDTEISLSNLTVAVKEKTGVSASIDTVQVEVLERVILGARENQTISISLQPLKPAKLILHQVTYDFLSLLPSTESLSFRGRRLHDTRTQRQKPTYAPDVVFEVDALEADHGLAAVFSEDSLSLLEGEYKAFRILLSNTGTKPITEVWVVAAPEDEVWLGEFQDIPERVALKSETLQSSNSLLLDVVYRLPSVATEESPLQSGDSREVPIMFHVDGPGRRELSLLLTYREGKDMPFQSIRLSREYEVQPLLEFSTNARPCESAQHSYMIDLEITSSHPSSIVELVQVTTLSPSWECTSLNQEKISLHPSQCSRIIIGASPWTRASRARETLEYVSAALGDVIIGGNMQQRRLPTIGLLCSHVHEVEGCFSAETPMIQHFIQRKRQQIVSQNITQSFSRLPISLHSSIFPLYNPFAVDVLVFWSVPRSNRLGHVVVSGLTLGARHAIAKEVIETAKTKTKALYAETRREQAGVLDDIRNSEWNLETSPLSVSVQNPELMVHDFSNGPFTSHASLLVRNCSITHTVRFVMKFMAAQEQLSILVGRTTFRGTLEPCQSMMVRPKVFITRPGTYPLDCWSLTAEMLAMSGEVTMPFRHYDLQPSSREPARLIVSDIHTTVT